MPFFIFFTFGIPTHQLTALSFAKLLIPYFWGARGPTSQIQVLKGRQTIHPNDLITPINNIK